MVWSDKGNEWETLLGDLSRSNGNVVGLQDDITCRFSSLSRLTNWVSGAEGRFLNVGV